MKKILYTLGALLLVITCIMPMQTIKAKNGISKVQLIEPNVYVRLPMSNGGTFTSILGYVHVNNQLVYCVEPYKLIDSGVNLAPSSLLNEKQRDEISLLSYFGYNQTTRKSDKWYMATQLVIWESLGHSFRVEGFDDYQNYKQTILQDRQDFNKLPSFNDSKITIKANENKLLNDTFGVFSKYKHVNHTGKADVKVDKNQLHVSTTSNAYQEGEVRYQKLSDDEVGLPIVYSAVGNSSVQSVIYPKIKQNVQGKVQYRVQPYGTFSLNKIANQLLAFKSEQIEGHEMTRFVFEDAKLDGIKAVIYAKEDIKDVWGTLVHKKDSVVDTLVSGSKDKSKALLAGKYYLKEIETLDGYVLDKSTYDFTIDANAQEMKEVKLDLVNKRSKVQIELEKQMEQGSLLDLSKAYEDVRFAIYTRAEVFTTNKKTSIPSNTMVYYSGIDENGKLKEPVDLPLGSYVLKEVATNAHYEKNENEYPFDVVSNGSESIVVSIHGGVIENKLIRRDLTIHKQGDSEEPLQAKFALYDANKEEIQQFTTNKEGTFVIENLLQGTYFVKEIEAPKGYRYTSEMHKIEVMEDTSYTITNVKNKEGKAVQTSDSTNHKPFAWSMLGSMSTMYVLLFRKFMKF